MLTILDPTNRIMAIGIGLFVILILWRFIIKGVKVIFFVAIVFGIIYFGLKYFATPIQ